jgi:hypothetical protein
MGNDVGQLGEVVDDDEVDVRVEVVGVDVGVEVDTEDVVETHGCFRNSVTPVFGQKLFGSEKLCTLYCSQHNVCSWLVLS